MTDPEAPLSNRHRAKQPGGKHWCMVCDGAYITAGTKCPRCGTIGSKGRRRPFKTSDWRGLA